MSIKLKPQHIFLLLASIFGLLWVLLVPPFQSADEFAHFYRAYEISERNLVTENIDGQIGNYLPSAIRDFEAAVGGGTITRNYENKASIDILKDAAKIHVTPGENDFFLFPSSAVYHPIVYLPQAIGIKIGSLLDTNLLVTFYLGRFFNLFAYIAMTYFAIKLIPKLKYTLLLLSIMPMTLNQAASLSADALTNGALFLFFAYLMYLIFNIEIKHINRKQVFILLVLTCLVAASKNAYFLFCLLVVLLPKEKTKGFKQYITYVSAIIASGLLVVISWMIVLKYIHVTFPIDPKAQLLTVFQHPFQFTEKLINTFVEFDYLYIQFVGVFGWGETSVHYLSGIIFLCLLTVSVIIEMKNTDHPLNDIKRGFILFAASILTVIIIASTLYLTWTQEAGNVIYGIQGRYFIPVSIIFLYSIYLLTPLIKRIRQQYVYSILIIVVLLLSLQKIVHRFWPV
ncbi:MULTISPECIES: DUF2142 domain-containing protein [Paenibacillus]|uniref:DUF2142 domain-containing protein n=1 Tax=Paenibacillus borealis TaxID=160799 RepID=A0ABX3GZC6_PAEBO|nr:DUF2142 domain-containing protein [Paenibacillus borealis]OMD40530.1 hypothetical protein BSK56_28675 [Paenibacillus borealis]